MRSATRSLTMLHRRPYGVAQALGSVVERSGKILICCCPSPLVILAERDLFGQFFLRDDYLFAIDWQGHPATGLRQPALLYVDLREALRSGQHKWNDRLFEGFNSNHAGVFHRRGWPRRPRPQVNAGFSLHPVCPHNPFYVVLFFSWLFLFSFFFVYVQFTAGRRLGKQFFGL